MKLLSGVLLLISYLSVQTLAQTTEKPCNLWQVCSNHKRNIKGTYPSTDCDDPSDVTVPVFIDGGYKTKALNKMTDNAQNLMATACPFYLPTDELCCNSDTAAIMNLNFQQLDGVFKTDCPICAANLKRMWCEYACSQKNYFLTNLGSTPPPAPYTGANYTDVQVSIDKDYACTLYTSCKGTSFIAAAGVNSAVGFLNFLGYNGAVYSRSYITFIEEWEGVTTSYLNSTSLHCQDPVPADGILWGYDGITNSSCSFCQKACPPPVVSDKIAFLDGFSWKIFGWSYFGFVAVTILFQVFMHSYLKKKRLEEAKNIAAQNQTATTAVGTSEQRSSRLANGRPVNMNYSDLTSVDGRKTMLSQESED